MIEGDTFGVTAGNSGVLVHGRLLRVFRVDFRLFPALPRDQSVTSINLILFMIPIISFSNAEGGGAAVCTGFGCLLYGYGSLGAGGMNSGSPPILGVNEGKYGGLVSGVSWVMAYYTQMMYTWSKRESPLEIDKCVRVAFRNRKMCESRL